jgi:hypothetical protein
VGEGLAKEYGLIAQKFMTFMTKTNADAKRMNGFTGIKGCPKSNGNDPLYKQFVYCSDWHKSVARPCVQKE